MYDLAYSLHVPVHGNDFLPVHNDGFWREAHSRRDAYDNENHLSASFPHNDLDLRPNSSLHKAYFQDRRSTTRQKGPLGSSCFLRKHDRYASLLVSLHLEEA